MCCCVDLCSLPLQRPGFLTGSLHALRPLIPAFTHCLHAGLAISGCCEMRWPRFGVFFGKNAPFGGKTGVLVRGDLYVPHPNNPFKEIWPYDILILCPNVSAAGPCCVTFFLTLSMSPHIMVDTGVLWGMQARLLCLQSPTACQGRSIVFLLFPCTSTQAISSMWNEWTHLSYSGDWEDRRWNAK